LLWWDSWDTNVVEFPPGLHDALTILHTSRCRQCFIGKYICFCNILDINVCLAMILYVMYLKPMIL
jgi:hypothetical protein